MQKISEEEKELFSSPEKFKKKARSLIIMGCVMLAVCVFFISVKLLTPNKSTIAEQYFQLGVDCLPLVIAVYFELKQLFDKKILFDFQAK